MKTRILLLSGGEGKRLWPLCGETKAKQFLPLLSDDNGNTESMLKRLIRQLEYHFAEAQIIIAAGEHQKNAIEQEIGTSYTIICEPVRRNTFGSIVLSSRYMIDELHYSLDDIVLVLPVDMYVERHYFKSLKDMVRVASLKKHEFVLMGIFPYYEATRFGYIIPKTSSEEYLEVERFVEKPDKETAALLIKKHALWNAGVSAFSLSTINTIIIREVGEEDFHYYVTHYENMKKESFDVAILEKSTSLALIHHNGPWHDIGTWDSVCEVLKYPQVGNVKSVDCTNTSVINNTQTPIVTMGLEGVIVVATDDGILITDAAHAPHIKDVIEKKK